MSGRTLRREAPAPMLGSTARESMRRGWCPGARRPMETGDGLLVRVHPRHGRLSADALRGVAEAAVACGNGVIDLTGRGNLQIRGVSPAMHPDLLARLDNLGLLEASDAVGPLRATILSPLAGADPTDLLDAEALAEAVERAITPELRAVLPPKFGIVVDGGGALALDDVVADLRLRAVASPEAPRVAIAMATRTGESWIGTVMPEDAAAAARALVSTFAEEVARNPGIRRLRDLTDAARERMIQAITELHAATEPPRRPPSPRVGSVADGTAVLLGLPFGQTTAALLDRLAELSERFGSGEIRLSPWRSVAVMGLSRGMGVGRDTAMLSLDAPSSHAMDRLEEAAGALPSPLRGGAGGGGRDPSSTVPEKAEVEASLGGRAPFGTTPTPTPPRKGEGTSATSGSRLPGESTPTPAPSPQGGGEGAPLSTADLLDLAGGAGLIVDPDDARTRIVTCPGAPACGRGLAATLSDAARLATVLPAGWRLHLSGCAKGCAGQGKFDLTFVAEPCGYALIPNGGVTDAPALRLTINEAVAALARAGAQPGSRPETLAAPASGPVL